MAALENKIDFAIAFAVNNANPNGDPLNGNRPRTTSEGLGEVSDVALKRKIRNRLQDAGESVFVRVRHVLYGICACLNYGRRNRQKHISKNCSRKAGSDEAAVKHVVCDDRRCLSCLGER